MGTTAQKLQRVLDTKEGLKDTINTYLGQDITSAIPFKDYETYIKNFYGELPKTSYAEGSNITLSNTLKGKLDFEDGIVGYGDTSQNSTQGYNIFNPSITGVGTYYCTASISSDNIVSLKATHDGEIFFGNALPTGNNYTASAGIKIPIKPSTTYRVSVENQDMTRVFVTQLNDSDVSLGFTQASPTFTTQANAKYIVVRYGVYTAVNNQTYSTKIWIYEGSTEKPYEPYTGGIPAPNPSYPQDIEVVRGKNLIKEVKNSGVTTAYSGIIYLDIANDIQANTTYTLSFIGTNGYKVYLNENLSSAQWITCTGSTQSITFTTNSNIDKTNSGQYSTSVGGWVIFKNQTGNTETPNFTNVQLEKRKCSYFLSTL